MKITAFLLKNKYHALFLPTLAASPVDRQRMVDDFEPVALCDFTLSFFDFVIMEFFDMPAIHTNDMVMMRSLVELEYSLAGFEIIPRQYPGLFELRQDPIHRRQPDFQLVGQKQPVDILGAQMPLGILQISKLVLYYYLLYYIVFVKSAQ